MIRVGIGGWTFEPWRGTFYPDGLAQARELEYASRQVTAIEINGTFYGSQKPASFRRWAEESPDGFVFSLKAPRFATNRKVLAEAGPSIEKFLESGVTELKSKLGPILWQFPPFKKFEPEDFSAFLALLPESHDGHALRHVLEVRHESFCAPDFIALARKHKAAVVVADSAKYPLIADVTGDFVYARLQQAAEAIPTGYSDADLDLWKERAQDWAQGGEARGLPLLAEPAPKKPRDVFVYMINGAKIRAPAAAKALIERLG